VYHYQGWDRFRSSDFVDKTPHGDSYLKETHIPLKKLRDFIRSKSVLYKFLGRSTRMLRERLGISKPRNVGVKDWTNNDPEISLIYDDESNLKTLFWTGHRLKGVNLNDKNIKEGLRLSLMFLDLMQKKANDAGIKLFIALIPSKESVYAKKIGSRAEQNELFKKILIYENAIKKEILDYCGKEKILCLDLLSYLQAELNKGLKLYKETWDEHPNALGYQKYAEVIALFLKDNNLASGDNINND